MKPKKKTGKRVLLMLVSLMILGIVGCTNLPPVSNPGLSKAIEMDREATVMLIQRSDITGKYRPYCSGVWVSESQILTAYHCVRNEDNEFKGEEVGDTVEIGYRSDLMSLNEKESIIKEGHAGIVVKVDPLHDLALIKINKNDHPHGMAEVAKSVHDGDSVLVVGHPLGLVYTWVPGTVVGARNMQKDDNEPAIKVLHITSSAWFGNSGGAAFNMNGEIVGICSFVMRGPQMTFFIHRDEIVKFLR